MEHKTITSNNNQLREDVESKLKAVIKYDNEKSDDHITLEEEDNVNKTVTFSTREECEIKSINQDIVARSKALKALESDIQIKNKIRVEILEKIFNYLEGITVAVVFLVIFGKVIGIGSSVEVALIGTVLGSVISTIVLFCKYAFSDSTNLVDLFLNLGENKKDSTNKK